MITDNIGQYALQNGSLIAVDTVFEQQEVYDISLYEIIRVIDGIPLFFNDHLERLYNSLNDSGVCVSINVLSIKRMFFQLLKANNKTNCNIKILYCTNNNISKLILYIVKSYYPSLQQYQTGIKTCLYTRERKRPNIKIADSVYKESVNKVIKEKGVFEALLVNKDNIITEGSRSNVFFLKENRIITSPENIILKGITRKYIFEACKNLGITVEEKPVYLNELNKTQALFISGTSVKVLPVGAVEEHTFPSAQNPLLKSVMKEYDILVERYLQTGKNIVLTGMPGAGKTTCGKLLAQKLQKVFSDTDNILRHELKSDLKEYVEKNGHESFLQQQEKILCPIEFKDSIVATGGSVVYNENLIKHLKNNGVIVFLKNSLDEIIKRAGSSRRFARSIDKSVEGLFDERMPLYSKYADIIIECDGKNPDEISDEIVRSLKG